MMSASSMSAMIRAKKKKMMEDESGAIKLSGIPEDAIDEMIIKNKEEGERLSTNTPKDHDEDPMLAHEVAEDSKDDMHEMMEPNPELMDEEKAKKNAKIKAMMVRMR